SCLGGSTGGGGGTEAATGGGGGAGAGTGTGTATGGGTGTAMTSGSTCGIGTVLSPASSGGSGGIEISPDWGDGGTTGAKSFWFAPSSLPQSLLFAVAGAGDASAAGAAWPTIQSSTTSAADGWLVTFGTSTRLRTPTSMSFTDTRIVSGRRIGPSS